MRNKIPALALLASLFLSLCLCSVNPGGGGSDVGNGVITGKVLTAWGVPVPDVQVTVVASSFNPVTGQFDSASSTAITDWQGSYRFCVPAGNYNVFAIRDADLTRSSSWNVAVGAKEVRQQADTLRAPGTVTVQLGDSMTARGGYLYVPGSSIVVPIVPGTQTVTLDSVPAGVLPAVTVSNNHGADTAVVRYGVPVSAGNSVTVIEPAWKHAIRLVLNTAATGAGVTGNVTGFPVLVRLNAGNFHFDQAPGSGTDVKITKADGTPLPYEIERWDSAAGAAEIWVKTDTIYGGNDTQNLVMYWGNASATNRSNGPAVFDTSRGFVGVWHMNNVPAAGASIKDQTVNSYNGTPLGSFSASDLVDGAVGKGLHFNGINDAVYLGRTVNPGVTFTLEAWVYENSLRTYQRFIANQYGYTLWYDFGKSGLRFEYREKAGWRGIPQDGGAVQPMTTGAWYHLAGTFDGYRMRLYINGTLATVSGLLDSARQPLSDTLLFGSSWHTDYLNGVMDEIRIESRARSADWLRLCYMNQKQPDQLVIFKP